MKKSFLGHLFLCVVFFCCSMSVWGAIDCKIVDNGSATKSTKSNNVEIGRWTFDGTTGNVSYSASGYSSGMSIVLEYSTNGGSSWTTTSSYVRGSGDKTCSIPETANVIRFVTSTSNGGRTHGLNADYKVSNVCVEAPKYITASNLVFSRKTSAGKSVSDQNNVTFYNLKGETISTQLSGTNASMFSVNAITAKSTDCEGVIPVVVNFNPAEGTSTGDYTCTIMVSAGGKSTSFDVKASVTEATITSIKWNQNFTNLISVGNPAPIVLNASVVDLQDNNIDNAVVTYSSADDNVVSISNGVLTIVGDGRTTVTATYTSSNEDEFTSASTTKQVFVSDGSICNVMLVDEQSKVALNSYAGTKSYSWTAPAVSEFSFNLWRQGAGTQGAKVVCKDADGKTLATYNYANGDIPTKSTMKTESLPAGTKRLEFSSSGTLDKYFQNIVVEQATYFNVTSSSINAAGDLNASAEVEFNYSNLPTAISASLENAATAEVAVEATAVGGGCGDWKENAVMHLTFTPNGAGKREYIYNGNLILSYGAGENKAEVKVPLSVRIEMPYGDLNNGYAMFYNDDDVTLDGTTKAYTAHWNLDNSLSLRELETGDAVPAATPVLLHNASANFYTYTVEKNNTLAAVSGNAFIYTSLPKTVDPETECVFVLYNLNGEMVFYKFVGTVPQGKVVLLWDGVSADVAPAALRFEFEEGTNIATALIPVWEQPNQFAEDGKIYTIMGLEVSQPTAPGFYIQNGKKFFVR